MAGKTRALSLGRLIENDAVGGLRRQYDENPRLRLGVWVILALIVAYMFAGLSALAGAQRTAAAELIADARNFANLEPLEVWRQRADAARAAREQAESGLWRAESEGVAAAELAEAVRTAADAAGFQNVTVRGDALTRDEDPPVTVLRAELSAGATVDTAMETAFGAFLKALADRPERIKTTRLELREQGRFRIDAAFEATYGGPILDGAEAR